MEMKAAIKLAKDHVAELFSDDGGRDFVLEEIERIGSVWRVTIGFARPIPIYTNLEQQDFVAPLRRTFKVVKFRDDDQQIISVQDRERAN